MTRPNYAIIGERRCGTTTLAKLMSSHQDVFVHPLHDMNYFLENEIVGLKTWREGPVDTENWDHTHSCEDFNERFSGSTSEHAIGFKDADVLHWRAAHKRLWNCLPDARVIIILREPVSRAWSHYWNEVGKGREDLSFREALQAESDRSRRSAYAQNHLSYYTRGLYAQSIAELFKYYTKQHVLVVTIEKLRSNTESTLRKIFKFLEVDESPAGSTRIVIQNRNWTTVPRSWAHRPVIKEIENKYTQFTSRLVSRLPIDINRARKVRGYAQFLFRKPARTFKIPSSLREEMRTQYREHVFELENLLGRSFPEWGY